MNDTARHTIPAGLTTRSGGCSGPSTEARALKRPVLLGLAVNQFVPGQITGVGGWLVLRQVKRGGGSNIVTYAESEVVA